MNQWINEAVSQPINDSIKKHEPMNQWINESMKQCVSQSMKQWVTLNQYDNMYRRRISDPSNQRINEWTIGWVIDWLNERMNEWTNERMNEWMNEWINEWMNERTNERMNDFFVALLLDWATSLLRYTSSLSYFFSEQPLIWATSSLIRSMSCLPAQSRSTFLGPCSLCNPSLLFAQLLPCI